VGVDTYRFLRIDANPGATQAEFTQEHTRVNNADRELTTKYVCQAWMGDGRLIVCTEVGEIFLCEESGSYMTYIPESPTDDNFKLEACVAFSRGFIVAGNENGNGKFYAFEKCEDPKVAYRLINKEPITVRMEPHNHEISSIAISHSEDYVYFTTKSGQLLKVDLPLYDGAEVVPRFDFVHSPFHTAEITGLDVCVRK
jgi:hypothetical protein